MDLLITGAGSLGTALISEICSNRKTHFDTIRVIDNSEHALNSIDIEFGKSLDLRLILGDVKDRELVDSIISCSDAVIHTAARKFVRIGEYNPEEFIYSNIIGTLNIVKASVRHKIGAGIYIGSDKGVYPVNLYGLTKGVGEYIWLWANQVSKSRMSVVRAMNFWRSTGSVFETWDRQLLSGKKLTVTHAGAKRYFIKLEDAARFVLDRLDDSTGGEIFIPRFEEYAILDLARELSDDIKITGMERSEKIQEDLFTEFEKQFMTEHDWGWEISMK